MAKSYQKTEVLSIEEKLSCSVVALRAFERRDWKTLRKCGERYSQLGDIWGEEQIKTRDKQVGGRIRSLVTELAHAQLQDELQEMQNDPDCN